MPYTSLNSMNGGLFNVFSIRHQPDSIAKYAQLYCLVNDSSIAKKDKELTARMAASYNYNRYQKEAFDKEKKIHHTQLILVIFLIMGTIVALIIYAKWRSNLKKQELLRAEYANATDEYFKNLHTLQILESARKEVIYNIQDELKKVTTENQNYRLSVMKLNAQYENTKRELIQENEMLQSKIEELKRQDGIRQEIIKNQELGETDIVKRILFIAGHPLTNMTEKEWEKFITVFAHYYPSLLHDLNMSTKITQQEVRACLLICLSLRESDIAHMLDTSAQRITNIKMSLNKILFDDNSARSLYKNLSQRYGICSL